MAFKNPLDRPAAKQPCIYWKGTTTTQTVGGEEVEVTSGGFCNATKYFNEDDISCYNDGNCDGFGTCRGCSKYDQGGLKFDAQDGEGGLSQTPFNLQVINLRAKTQPCCHWKGAPVSLEKEFNIPSDVSTTVVEQQGSSPEATILVGSTDGFPNKGTVRARRSGSDVILNYSSKTEDSFLDVTISFVEGGTGEDPFVASGDTVFVPEDKAVPTFVPKSETPDEAKKEQHTFCELAEAAPWQQRFTEENPSGYGCNGAKPECPYYTGPRFTEIVDSKMDIGHNISAKQLLELRFYSDNWKNYQSPREVWEQRFERPDLWAWVKDPDVKTFPGKGVFDSDGLPRIQKVSIKDLSENEPEFVVGSPVYATTGTPVDGDPPSFPDLIREIKPLPTGLKLIWPRDTSSSDPYVKKSFTPEGRYLYISTKINSSRKSYLVNLSKHPQGSLSDEAFIKQMKVSAPEDLKRPVDVGMPGDAFKAELEYVPRLNHLRVYLDTGSEDGSWQTADVWVNHEFHHAHVAQTEFNDYYGHANFDPWIDHFTDFDIKAKIFNLGYTKTKLKDVYWNTIANNGKKTMYAIERVKRVTVGKGQTHEDVDWEPLECGHIVITFKDPKVNRVYPWRVSGSSEAADIPLGIKVSRDEGSESFSLENFEVAYKDSNGNNIPGNVVFMKSASQEAYPPFDKDKDELQVTYSYTEYVQGPLEQEHLTGNSIDTPALKFAEDADRVIDFFPYEVEFEEDSFTVEGTFLKAGSEKIRTCYDIIGDCYHKASEEAEAAAIRSFHAGGVDDGDIKSRTEILDECVEKFNAKHEQQKFADGTPINYESVSDKLEDMNLLEGSQHYLFVFEDEEGRPVGAKEVGFLTQSALPQARDVEIKYLWRYQLEYYEVKDWLVLLATLAKPTFAQTESEGYELLVTSYHYDPYCGDHFEARGSLSYPGGFDLRENFHGALWYPYNTCLSVRYRNASYDEPTLFGSTYASYGDPVEGFATGKRRRYWEKTRIADKYTARNPQYIAILGCFWTYRSHTLHAYPPFIFDGYTKIRSQHREGRYYTDRESIRVSRHWEKRNLEVNKETLRQEGDGYTIELSDSYTDALYNDNGELKTGDSSETPIWVHMNDGLSIVRPASEEKQHPFTNVLLERCGNHDFDEVFIDDRYSLSDLFEERDLTSNLNRSEDGSKVYIADGVELNDPDGILQYEEGTDVISVFKNHEDIPNYTGGPVGWSWLAEPDPPKRSVNGEVGVTGVFLYNPNVTYFKKNKEPATHMVEGQHTLNYEPPKWAADGTLTSHPQIKIDNGPPLLVEWYTGKVFFEAGVSPYDADLHTQEDYEFTLHSTDSTLTLADGRGLQRYTVDGTKYATYAGLLMGNSVSVEELPHETKDLRFVDRDISDQVQEKFDELIKEYDTDETSRVSTEFLDFKGDFFVEKVEIDFYYGDELDIPVVTIDGILAEFAEIEQLGKHSFQSGEGVPAGTTITRTTNVNQMLKAIRLSFGARAKNRKMGIDNIRVTVREPEERSEVIKTFSPKAQVSSSVAGTHQPSDLLFYFQRSYPDFQYLGEVLNEDGSTTSLGVDAKYQARRVKDLIPQFSFHDPIGSRFPYDNVDVTEIAPNGYVPGQIDTSSKGWTLVTNEHKDDPGSDLVHPEAFDKVALEDKQKELYEEAASLGGDHKSVFKSFWHPQEKEFFEKTGFSLDAVSWTLTLNSTVAPIERVFRHKNYGCTSELTSEYHDGVVHNVGNWQARGTWVYSCNPEFSWICTAVVMHKCHVYLYDEYGTPEYLDNNLASRFTYSFAFDPRDSSSYLDAGIIDKTYEGGSIRRGFGPTNQQDFFAQPPGSFGSTGGTPSTFFNALANGS